MNGTPPFRVFLSAVTSEFAQARTSLASDLRARGLEVKVQDDFRKEADADTTLRKLHDYIHACSAVVCIIGRRSGDAPPDPAVQPFANMLPTGIDCLSYTQWEFLFARHYRKRLSLYLANTDHVPDQAAPTGRDFPALQEGFIKHLKGQGLDRSYFSTIDQLCRLVLKEEWLQHRHTKPICLPYASLGTLFKGRDEFLQQLRASLTGSGQAMAIVGKAVHGLGGVGKTRLAVEYAWQSVDDYNALLFITADSPTNLQTNLAELVGPLVLNLPEQQAREHEVKLKAVLDWLQHHPGWFLIIDNVDTPEAAKAVEDLLRRLHGGQVLITSRLAHWRSLVKPLALDVLAAADAAAFLQEATQPPHAAPGRRHTASDPADALRLARTLDGLALALEQAAAYIAERRVSFADYLTAWTAHDQAVQAWHDPLVMQYPRSVASTWQTTIEQFGAGEFALLRLLSWYAPEPLPLRVFEPEHAAAVVKQATALVHAEIPGILPGAVDWQEAVRLLARYSMAEWDAEAGTIAVHRVVQEIVRNRVPLDKRKAWLEASLHLLNKAFTGAPTDVRSWPVLNPLAAHVDEAVQHADAADIATPTSRLMNQLGLLYKQQIRFLEAERLHRRALAIGEQSFGKDHPKVATRLNNLASLLHDTNRLAEAEPLMRRALAMGEQSFGNDHPNVAIRLNNLAQLLKATNRLADAEPLMRRALAIDEQSLGKDHPKVAIRLSNLAVLLKATNRLAEAEPLIRRALVIDEQSFGKDHPNVAIRLSNLAGLLQATNRLAEAEPLMARVVAILEKALGDHHPNVATALNNLASLLQDTNRLAEAEPLMRRALAMGEQSFGKDHPTVAIRLNNLASLLQATNRLAEAEPLMRRALAIDEQSFGKDHPSVAIDLNNLAALLQATNRLAEAEPLMRRALAIDEQSFGKDHPNVAIRLNNLAQLLKATNRLAEAGPLSRRMVAILLDFNRRTGHEHPQLRVVLANYLAIQKKLGRSEADIQTELEKLKAEKP